MHFTPAAIARWIDGGRVGVHGDVGAPVLGRFDGGPQLGLGEGGRVERAVGRRHAAAGRQLDLRRAQHELLAHAHADLVRTVGDHAAADLFHARVRAAEDARHFERLAEVAVTAGDGDDGAGRIDARAGDDALVDGALEPERRPAQVANGGEPAQQRVRRLGAGHQVDVADVPREQRRGRRPHQHRVPVHVDQPGHQRAPAAVDDVGVGEALGRNRVFRDLLDRVPADENVHGGAQRSLLPSKMRTFWNSVPNCSAGAVPCAHTAGDSPNPIRRMVATKVRRDVDFIGTHKLIDPHAACAASVRTCRQGRYR